MTNNLLDTAYLGDLSSNATVGFAVGMLIGAPFGTISGAVSGIVYFIILTNFEILKKFFDF